MANQNCWEFKKCQREPGGAKVNELGVCPAATFIKADGYLGGRNGGRGCMYITGTFCGGNEQGTYRDKTHECTKCDFYKVLRKEHGAEVSVISFSDYI